MFHRHNYKRRTCDHSGHPGNYDKCERKHDKKTPSDSCNEVFKPCPTHGLKSKHKFKECYRNPKNQDKHQAHDKKCQYEAHHNNGHYTSDDNESRASVDTPVPSEDPASASSESKKTHEDENYHLHIAKKMKAGSHVHCKSDH